MTRTCCALCLLLTIFLGLIPVPPADALGERLVLAFYYAWYGMGTWQEPLPDRPLHTYMSTDPAAIERHVLWARQAGIDALVQSWYGPQVENNQTEPNFATLLDIAAQHGLNAAVDLEVTSPLIHSQADVVAALRHLLTVHVSHRAYLRVGGRPVVFFWRQNRYPVQSWYAIRDQVDPQRTSIWIMEGTDLEYLGPFDGNHLYSVAWDPEPEGTLVRWGQRVRDWNLAHGAAKYWVATVMPGYDDRGTGRPDAFVRDRAGGAYYRRCWDGAIRSGADLVMLTSFNEWMEGTQIEPSVSYGDFYLNLTRELADLYRVSEPPATEVPPTATVSPTDTPQSLLTPGPAASPTAMPSPTGTPTLTPTSTATPVPSATPTATATSTPLPTSAPAPSRTPIPTPRLSERAIEATRANSGLIVAGLALLLTLMVVSRSAGRPK